MTNQLTRDLNTAYSGVAMRTKKQTEAQNEADRLIATIRREMTEEEKTPIRAAIQAQLKIVFAGRKLKTPRISETARAGYGYCRV